MPGAQTEKDSGAVHSKDSGVTAMAARDSGSAHTDSGAHSEPPLIADAGSPAKHDAGDHDAGATAANDASVSHDAAVGTTARALTGTRARSAQWVRRFLLG